MLRSVFATHPCCPTWLPRCPGVGRDVLGETLDLVCELGHAASSLLVSGPSGSLQDGTESLMTRIQSAPSHPHSSLGPSCQRPWLMAGASADSGQRHREHTCLGRSAYTSLAESFCSRNCLWLGNVALFLLTKRGNDLPKVTGWTSGRTGTEPCELSGWQTLPGMCMGLETEGHV